MLLVKCCVESVDVPHVPLFTMCIPACVIVCVSDSESLTHLQYLIVNFYHCISITFTITSKQQLPLLPVVTAIDTPLLLHHHYHYTHMRHYFWQVGYSSIIPCDTNHEYFSVKRKWH